MNSNVSHADLLELSRSLQSAALGRDVDVIHTELCSLRNALVCHIRDESALFQDFSPAVGSVVRRGQQQLLRSIDEILAHADEADDECLCVAKVSRLTRAIARQASLEHHLMKVHG